MDQRGAATALVTGGSRGIGARLAQLLADDGTHVTLTYRRAADAADIDPLFAGDAAYDTIDAPPFPTEVRTRPEEENR